jgi:capsular polysaccharide biosynthesis protein
MTEQNQNNSNFNLVSFIGFIWRWRKPLLIVTISAIVLSTFFSSPWFITPKFKSQVIMFPASSNAISKALLVQYGSLKTDILEFGEEEQAEQMLQILNANSIRGEIIRKYNLIQHYNIDSTSETKNDAVGKEFESNISFKRTEYMAVAITVMDKDPQIAADIANDIADLLDSTKIRIQRDRAMQAYKIVEDEYNKLVGEIQTLEDSIIKLNRLGVFHYESQSERLNQQLAIALSSGNARGVKEIQKRLDVLANYGTAEYSINLSLEHERSKLSVLKSKYEEARVDAFERLPQKFIVERAYKAERKSYPIRWLIVVSATFSALFFCLLFLMFFDAIKRFKAENDLIKG